MHRGKINTNTNAYFTVLEGGGGARFLFCTPPCRLLPPQETDKGRGDSRSGRRARKTREWP